MGPRVNDWQPLCFESAEQMRRWRDAATQSCDRDSLKRSRYCVDCTPEYQQRMKAQRRCLHPDTTFTTDPDGLICGVRAMTRKTGNSASGRA